MLHPKIIEITTDKQTGETYVLVRFWKTKAARARGDVPFLIEDFIIPLRLTGTRIVTSDDGWFKRKDTGEFVNPARLDNPDVPDPEWEREEFERDLDAEIREIIGDYVVRAEQHGYEGDNTSGEVRTSAPFLVNGVVVRVGNAPVASPRQRDESDPHRILVKPEVAELRGKDIDLPARARR